MSLNVRSGQGQIPTLVLVQNVASTRVATISPSVLTEKSTFVTVGNVPNVALADLDAIAQGNRVVRVLNVPGTALRALPAVSNFKTRVTATLKNLPIGGNGFVHSVVGSTQPQTTARKFFPGHYVLLQKGDQSSTTTIASRFTEIASETNIRGVIPRIDWNLIEGATQGSYTWTLLDFIRDQAVAAGKKWMVLVIDRQFNSGTDPNSAPVPFYVKNLDLFGVGGTLNGVTVNDHGALARIWRQDVMDRQIALFNAIFARYDSDDSFQGAMGEESSIPFNSTTPPTDWSATNLGVQLRRLQSGVASPTRRSIFFSNLNYLSNDPNLLSTVQGVTSAANYGQGITGPDICVNPTSGPVPLTGYTTAQSMWIGAQGAGSTAAHDFRPEGPAAFMAQTGGTRQHTFQEIYDGMVLYGNTHMIWEHAEPASGQDGYGLRWSLVLSNLHTGSFNGYRVACPTSFSPETVMSISSPSVTEGNSGTKLMTFTVSVNAPQTKAITFHYQTEDGTATAGSDYVATSGTGTIPIGSTSYAINVTINGDTVVEPDETLRVRIPSSSIAWV